MYYGPMNGYDWGWTVIMNLFWLIILILLIYIAVKVLRNHEAGSDNRSSSLDIAKERYAKGEITKEQYEQLKKDLQ